MTDQLQVPYQVLDWLVRVIHPIYESPKSVFNDVVYALNQYQYILRPKTKVYTDVNGVSQLLLCLYGKIGVDNSIPIILWIPVNYLSNNGRDNDPWIVLDFDILPENYEIVNEHHGAEAISNKYVKGESGIINIPSLSHNSSVDIATTSPLPGTRLCNIISELLYIFKDSRAITNDMLSSISKKTPPLPIKGTATSNDTSTRNIMPSLNKPTLPPKQSLDHDKSYGPTTHTDDFNEYSPPAAVKVAPVPAIPQRPDKLTNFQSVKPNKEETQQPIQEIDYVGINTTDNDSSEKEHLLNTLQRIINNLGSNDKIRQETALNDKIAQVNSVIKGFEKVYDFQNSTLKKFNENIQSSNIELKQKMNLFHERQKILQQTCARVSQTPVKDLIEENDEHDSKMIHLVAKDRALEDAIYMLFKLFNALCEDGQHQSEDINDNISLESYLKKTRKLAREQFMVRYEIYSQNINNTDKS
ncbi:ubiquitin-binding ESCRT-I subunit protein STP22 SCDLUD_003425 [Saccharomycodes ludwigii]|uniref:ubiquitin-binding ESCRT-I subunit protein STP22 n=1 Tax=Saccharomycodes ludwigii TaxID=36035 RepID=UPI001E8967FF|nr:hypothetical protein SCDLUD_003425 [Saccharomycodes ludwigii]KAH3900443.1 hypothetical protein SCDLUD_003425 [Saccharomycodes ludwigii]